MSKEGEILPHLVQLRKALSKFHSVGIGCNDAVIEAEAALLILIRAKFTLAASRVGHHAATSCGSCLYLIVTL